MAISQVSLGFPSGAKFFTDTDSEGTVVAISAASATVYAIEVDNSGNAGAASYVKLWNTAAASVTLGTTAPDMVILVPASASPTLVVPKGIVFGTALSIATVTTAGTAGTTSPTSAVTVRVVYA